MSSDNLFEQVILAPLISNITSFSGKNAFRIKNIFYTYAQFGETISRIHKIIKDQREDLIGLVANDDLETYAAIIAIWLNGKGYVPLHPKHPVDRTEKIAGEMGLVTILDSRAGLQLPGYSIIDTSQPGGEKSSELGVDFFDKDRLVYVLFTSGSTGIPKGVQISRENLGSFMEAFWATDITLSEEDKCLQCFDLTFDVSVQSFLAPLLRGACVYTVPHEEIKYSYSYSLLEDEQLTFCVFVPSMLRYLRPYFDEINLPAVRNCIMTAEASPADLASAWQICVPNAQLYNFYGPTETTIYCAYYTIPRDGPIPTVHGMLSIGKLMKGVSSIIIDEDDKVLPAGKEGELCISGKQVTAGYWRNSEKNMASFLRNEDSVENVRFYRTGDRCYIDEAGHLMLVGRKDSQVKVHGYRVDIGEIEFHARRFENVGNAVIIPFTNNIGNTELALFAEGKDINSEELVTYMKDRLPHYLMPSKIIFEAEFKLNASSKVDRTILKEKLNQNL